MFLKRRTFFNKCDKILYLPIEIYSRELHAKLHLAYQASKKGWVVVIGPEYDVNKIARYLPSGVYFGNGFHKKATKVSKLLKKSGHYIIVQDEEGLVRWAPDLYKEYRIYPEISNFVDYFLCWGEEDKKIVQSAFQKTVNAVAVGNLRFDLLSSNLRKFFLNEVNDIKKDNGEFVLINGNFGSTNHTLGENYYLNEIKLRGWLDSPSKKKYQLERVSFQRKIFKKMIELSISLAKSGQKVIVRPHPSENLDVWKKETESFSQNIKIIRSGNVIPWLMASKLVIHNGCNTAIEAFLLDQKIISYRPYKNSNVETYLPNAVSICLENKGDIILHVKKFKSDQLVDIERRNSLKILSNNVKINKLDEDASTRILDLIEKLSLYKKNNLIETVKNNICIEISLIKSIIGRAIFKKNFLYLKKKCPKLDIEYVTRILDFFRVNNDTPHKVEALKLTKHSIVVKTK
jgi:surface carbohydrate biosynthesis protein